MAESVDQQPESLVSATAPRTWRKGTFLARLSQVDYKAVKARGRDHVVPAGTVLLSQGVEQPPILLVQSGTVKVGRIVDQDSESVLVDVAGPGDGLGLESCFTAIPGHLSYEAATTVKVTAVPRLAMQNLLFQSTSLLATVAAALASRTTLRDTMLGYAGHRVDQRLAAFLTRLEVLYGIPAAGDSYPRRIDIGLSYGDLGSAIGASETMVAKVLGKLRDSGSINTGYKWIEVLEPLTREMVQQEVSVDKI
jgi:CRP-like cAMP-binding protein